MLAEPRRRGRGDLGMGVEMERRVDGAHAPELGIVDLDEHVVGRELRIGDHVVVVRDHRVRHVGRFERALPVVHRLAGEDLVAEQDELAHAAVLRALLERRVARVAR